MLFFYDGLVSIFRKQNARHLNFFSLYIQNKNIQISVPCIKSVHFAFDFKLQTVITPHKRLSKHCTVLCQDVHNEALNSQLAKERITGERYK